MANIVPLKPDETLEDTYGRLNKQFTGLDTDVKSHKASNQAHSADAITYDGKVVGAGNTKQAIDNVQEQVNTLVLNGDSSVAAKQAAIDANGHDYKNLKLRLDTEYTQLSEQLADKAKHISLFPRLIPEVDDSGRLTRAFNSGYSILLEKDKTYLVNNIRINTSDFSIYGNGATLSTTTLDGSCLLIDAPNKNIKILDLNFVGRSDGSNRNAAGINLGRNGTTYIRGENVVNVEVANCKFLGGFIFGIIATGATTLNVHDNFFTGNFYTPSAGAGGYGILAQTCYDVYIHDNRFIGQTNDRHAIYISEDGGRTDNHQSEDVTLRNNYVDWRNAGTLGNETCIMIRSVKNIKVLNNTCEGGYGGIDFEPSKGNVESAIIEGNILNYQISNQTTERGAINMIRGTVGVSWRYLKAVITKNVIKSANNKVHGISVVEGTGINIVDNVIELGGNGYGILMSNTVDLIVKENNLKGSNGAYGGLVFTGTHSDVLIGKNMIKGFAYPERYFSSVNDLTNVVHDYKRSATIESNGSGSVTIKKNLDNLIASITSSPYGCIITFNPHYKVSGNHEYAITPYFGAFDWGVRGENTTNNSIEISIRDFAGVNKPMATNQIGFTIHVFG